jgi:hypothetical protein
MASQPVFFNKTGQQSMLRLIIDNVLAAYETFHSMHMRMWSKVGYMGIMLDMSKAYDRVK